MDKYIMISFNGNDSVSVVRAIDIKDAMVEFVDFYGICYPLNKKDIENLVKDFTIDKFIDWFENTYNHTIYGIYKIDETIFNKVGNENG